MLHANTHDLISRSPRTHPLCCDSRVLPARQHRRDSGAGAELPSSSSLTASTTSLAPSSGQRRAFLLPPPAAGSWGPSWTRSSRLPGPMSDSEDDLPLAKMYGQTQDGSDSSEMPDWIRNHQTPIKLDVSSGDEDEVQAPDQGAAGAGPSSSKPPAAAAAAAAAPGAGPSKAAASARPAPGAPPAAVATAAAVLGSNRSELQLILPEQLQRNKVLVELEPAAHGATDLSGDAGAVGRLLLPKGVAEGGSQSQQLTSFLLDLKGVLYSSTVVPLAGTAMVVNIGPGDARVESVMNDFVRLGEESSYLESGMLVEGGGAGGVGDLMGSDDEHYLPDVAAVAGASQQDKPGAKGKPKKKAGGGKGGAGAGSLKARGGGVSKKAAGSSRKAAGTGGSRKKAAAGSSSKPAKKAAGSAAKKAAGSAAKKPAAAAANPKAKKSKKPADSEEEDVDMTSEESEPDWSEGSD